MRHKPEGDTVPSGRLDEATLHGVLMRIRDLDLKLVAVNHVEATGAS